jgi:enoyl-CoA hydratase/carnithine racemase
VEETAACNQLVCYERIGDIAIISINRPKALNAINRVVYSELTQVFQRVEADPNVHVVVLKGSDNHFAAGADVNDLANATILEAEAYINLAHGCVQAIYSCSIPVIAYLRGYVLGGGMELALACDMRLAGDDVKLGLPEVNLGIIPGSGGTQRLPQLVGPAKAKELLMTGRMVDAAEALQLGLVNRVFSSDQAWAEVLKFAEKLAAKPLQATRKVKAAVNAAMHLNLWDGLQYESNSLQCLFGSPDQRNRMREFLDKQRS